MKRLSLSFSVVLVVLLGVATMAHAWGLPKRSFNHAIEKALQKERWNKPDEAKEYWQEALKKGEILLKEGDPENAEYLMGTARAWYAKGEYAKAAALYEKMLSVKAAQGYANLADSYPWPYVYLGLCFAHQGDCARAAEFWKQVPLVIGSVSSVLQEQVAKLSAPDASETTAREAVAAVTQAVTTAMAHASRKGSANQNAPTLLQIGGVQAGTTAENAGGDGSGGSGGGGTGGGI